MAASSNTPLLVALAALAVAVAWATEIVWLAKFVAGMAGALSFFALQAVWRAAEPEGGAGGGGPPPAADDGVGPRPPRGGAHRGGEGGGGAAAGGLCGTLEAQEAGVLAAQRAGRYLEAARLLEEAGNEAHSGADAAGHVRETCSRVEETLELLRRLEGGGPDSGWSETSGPGYKVLYKYDGSTGEAEVVGNITLDFGPLKLWTLLREFDLLPTWNASSLRVDLEASFASQCDFYHSRSKPVVARFMNPSESYLERTYVDALAEHGKLMVVGRCPAQLSTQHCGLDIPLVPRNVNRVVATSFDVVTPRSEDQVVLTSYRKLKTPIRNLPQWVVRQGASLLTKGNVTSFYKALASWDDSPFAERLRTGQRVEYYAQLRQQLLAATSVQRLVPESG